MSNIFLYAVSVLVAIFAATYYGVVFGAIRDEQGKKHKWQGLRVEVGEAVRYVAGAVLLALSPIIYWKREGVSK